MANFPKNFLWGVATSAYQIEGAVSDDGRGPSIWDVFCRIPGVVSDGSNGDVACDHYRCLETDLDLIAELGLSAYRFSVAWPRIQPEGKGRYNEKGLAFYDRLVDGLLKRNITPFVTLYHWDLPQALQEKGGWAQRDTARYFADYAEIVAKRLGDRAQYIATHNEPSVVTTAGHLTGEHAPGIRDRKTAVQVSHHLLFSHGLAVKAMRAAVNGLKLGIVINLSPTHATDSAEDVAQAKLADGIFLRWYLDALFLGKYPADVVTHYGHDAPKTEPGDFDTISQPIDFFGLNYYSPRTFGDASKLIRAGKSYGFTEMGWEVYPDGFFDLVMRLNSDYQLPPIYVTENGAAYTDVLSSGQIHDSKRTQYLQTHIESIARAISAGVDIRGYFVWSLMDNFEWSHGYTKRFGIVYVDYATQRRILKDSGIWYRDFLMTQR